MSARPALRLLQATRAARTPFRGTVGRRFQSTEAAPVTPSRNIFQKLWHSPVGVKTVHFWAPVMKWGLVLAGVSDFARPAESLSLTQNFALMCTGMIWTRWCFIIKPRNIFLAAVNFFLGCVGLTQVTRIFLHNRSIKDTTISQELEQAKDNAVNTAKELVDNPSGVAKKSSGPNVR